MKHLLSPPCTTPCGVRGSDARQASLGARTWKRFVIRRPQLCMRYNVQVIYDLAPVIADVISAHCQGTRARSDFVRACLLGEWDEAKEMVEGMLAEPWHLQGYQENRLREFLELVQVTQGEITRQ